MNERPGLKQTNLKRKLVHTNCSLNHKRLQLNSIYTLRVYAVHDLSSDLNKLPTGFSEVIDLIIALPLNSIENYRFFSLVKPKSKLLKEGHVDQG